jgi:hypothetical protein
VIRISLLWLAVVMVFLLPDTPPQPQPGAPSSAGQRVEAITIQTVAAASAVLPPARPGAANVDLRAANASVPPGSIRVCGGKVVKLDARGALSDDEAIASDTRALRRMVIDRIGAGRNDLERGVALLLKAMDASPRPPRCEGDKCADATQQPSMLNAQHVDTLARLAVGTSDAKLYQLAYTACAHVPNAEAVACQMLSTEQWVRLDSSNAVPWMFKANRAQLERNPALVIEAIHHVSKAQRSDAAWATVAGVVESHLPADEKYALGASTLLMELLAQQSAWGSPSYGVISNHCSDDQLRDANRRQVCAEAAEVLFSRTTSPMDQAVGAMIGKRLGWPERRLEAYRIERQAMTQAGISGLPTGAQGYTCEGIQTFRRHVRDLGQYGEVEALRRVAARSGQSTAELAEAHRLAMGLAAEDHRKLQAAARAASQNE